jgi:aminoglycoside phosphotransferase (APT) family kinase protein
MNEPPPQLVDRAARLLGWTPERWRPVAGGYTPAARYLVERGSERAFVKIATTPMTASHMRGEISAYRAVKGPFMPRLIGCEDDADAPMLAIEDLSGAAWPPPWDRRSLDAVLAAIEAMHACAADLPPFAVGHPEHGHGWATVAANPAEFLSVGLASPEWLADALPALMAAEAACETGGDALCHFDLRSDNMCVTRAGAVFVDWSSACLANPRFDLGAWLPSLAFEGGPLPEDILPDAPDVAAWISGYFAARAGQPIIPDAPFVRRVQREQLTTALPWAARALGLPPT